LDGNFLYCPNQFLDLCLPNCSRGAVRLVAYLLDQTLGWLDKQGNPISQTISISYQQLIRQAGISRGAIRKAIDEASDAGFIFSVQEGRAAAKGESAQQAAYALRWDEREEYQKDLENFRGFYRGEGYRTPIPNAFFRQVIPHESLIISKVVGTVLRHTVGYQNQFGGRRSQAPLAYRFIQEFANIPDPKSLSRAISHAIASKYIVRVESGRFHNNPADRKPASYAIRWEGEFSTPETGSDTLKEEQFRNPSSDAGQYSQQEEFKNPGRSGSENPAGEQFIIPSNQRTGKKDIRKQQLGKVESVVAEESGFELLLQAGFDELTARSLATMANLEQISQQIEWLQLRKVGHNRLGMLRRAIEQNWSKPEGPEIIKAEIRQRRDRDQVRSTEEERENQRIGMDKQNRARHREELKSLWDELSQEEQHQIETTAFEHQQGIVLKNLFRTKPSHRLRECLAELDRQLTPKESSTAD
ncbi:MAG: hypothetical protein KC931_18870, partial [Candidatus Omnitrophica bacterium]|nr:hypothetical protein [Candidatus Omnitrophota bacterium]